MGQLANDIVNGVICRTCNGYIGPACGYPRECNTCKSQENEDE